MKTVVAVDQVLTDRIKLVSYPLAFALPIFIPHPQWITGALVNALLFVAAERLSRKDLFPLLLLPSLGALTQGILFGPLTVFLYYFLPFIWLGNYLLTLTYSQTNKLSLPLRITSAAMAKYFLLIVMANIYWRLHLVPQLFLSAMGIMQLITALAGGILAVVVNRWLKTYE